MILASNYNFASFLWDVLVIFAFVIWFWLLIIVFSDLFSRHDISGWAKAGWTVFVIILPFLGIFIYLIAEGKGMGERAAQRAQGTAVQVHLPAEALRVLPPGPTGGDVPTPRDVALDTPAVEVPAS